jgi:hypothetical protein
VPFAVYERLLYGGFVAVAGGLLNPMGSAALFIRDIHVGVVAGCTCFFAVLVAGLLVLWMWLVREYGARTPEAVRSN